VFYHAHLLTAVRVPSWETLSMFYSFLNLVAKKDET